MDDAKIKELTEEVLSQIRGGAAAAEPSGIEGRVAALEAAVRSLRVAVPSAGATVIVAQVGPAPSHPALALLGPSGGGPGSPCILEPDKPCVGSGQCRSFGH